MAKNAGANLFIEETQLIFFKVESIERKTDSQLLIAFNPPKDCSSRKSTPESLPRTKKHAKLAKKHRWTEI
jgi:hypothetical protein